MTKRVLAIVLAFMLVLPTVVAYADDTAVVPKNETIEIHVSPNGSATGDGSEKHPLDSMETVKKVLLETKYKYPKNPIDVIFHEGEYRFGKRVDFNSEFSGTERAPITFRAAEGEGRPIFKGSKKLDLSKLYRVTDPATIARIPVAARDSVIAIDLAAQGVTEYGEYHLVPEIREGNNSMLSAVYFNDNQQIRARWPNGEHEFSRPTKIIDPGKQRGKGQGATFQIDSYRLMNWTTADEMYYIGFPSYDYMFERLRVKSIDPLNRSITNLDGNVYAEGMRLTYSGRCAVENLLEELDVPGEYYIDRADKTLYYYPERSLQGATLEISYLIDHLMWFEDTNYITFDGIEFDQLNKFAFRAVGRCDYFTVRDCIFRNYGYAAFGIDSPKGGNAKVAPDSTQVDGMDGGSEHVTIENNAFYHGGVWGFNLLVGSRSTNVPSGSIVRNNYIYDVGTYSPASHAMDIEGVGLDVQNNTVQYTGYGMMTGSSGDADYSYNELANVMGNVADGAAIYDYRAFLNRNREIHHNYIHESKGRATHLEKAYCYGIYSDGMASGAKVHHNIVANSDAGYILNAGSSNHCIDNIFFNTTAYSLCFTGKGWTSISDGFIPDGKDAIKNPAYARYPDLVKDMETPEIFPIPYNNVVKRNLVTLDNSTKQTETVLKYNEWEKDIVVSEDNFVDPANYDYRLKADSEAAKLNPNALTDANYDLNTVGADKTKFKYPLEIGEEFKLTYPKNGATQLPTGNVEFNWQRPIGADKFTVIIATDPEMKNIVRTQETYETTTTVKDLDLGKSYYWKVKAKCSTRVGDLMEWESAGVPYMFSIVAKEAADTFDLVGAIATGKQTLSTMVESDKLGDYKVGTKAALQKAISKAEFLLNKRDRTIEDVANAAADIESITNDDNLINGGSVNFGTILEDKENWIWTKEQGTAEDHATFGENELVLVGGFGQRVDGGGSSQGHVSYLGVQPYSRLLAMSYRIKVDYPDDIAAPWFSLAFRAQNPASHAWIGGNHSYYFIMKKGGVEYQRNSPSRGSEWLEDKATPLSVEGEWMDVDMAVINLGNVGQLLLFMINGEIIYEIIDTSTAQMTKKGVFSISATERVKITVQPATRTLDFDELVEKYTAKMALEACENMQNHNEVAGPCSMIIMSADAKKAYYNRKLYDIDYPAYTKEKSLMVPITSFAKVIGASISGNTISYNGKTATFTVGSMSAMVNGAPMSLKNAPEMNNNNLCVDLTDLSAAIGWTAYNNAGSSVLMSDSYNMHITDILWEYSTAQDSLKLYK